MTDYKTKYPIGSQWQEPRVFEFEIIVLDDGSYAVIEHQDDKTAEQIDGKLLSHEIIALKRVTITEGEGMDG